MQRSATVAEPERSLEKTAVATTVLPKRALNLAPTNFYKTRPSVYSTFLMYNGYSYRHIPHHPLNPFAKQRAFLLESKERDLLLTMECWKIPLIVHSIVSAVERKGTMYFAARFSLPVCILGDGCRAVQRVRVAGGVGGHGTVGWA